MASFLSNIFSLAIPVFFMQVYDRIMVYNSRDTLIWLTAVIITVLLLDLGVRLLRGRLASLYAFRYAYSREQLMMEQLYSLSEDDLRRRSFSDLDDNFRRISHLQGFYAGQFFQSLLDLPFALFFLYIIYFIGGSIVYFHLIVLVLFVLIQFVYRPLIRSSYSRSSASRVKRLSFLREMLEQIHFIKAQACEEVMLRKLDSLQEELSFRDLKMARHRLLPQTIGGILTHLMVYGSIVFGGYMVMRGEMTVGVVTAVTMLSRRLIGPLQSSSSFFSRLVQAGSDLDHMELNPQDQTINYGKANLPDSIRGNLAFRDVSYEPGDEKISGSLSNINFTAEQGTVSVILCKDESGADSLKDLIKGVRRVSEGDIILDTYILSNFEELFLSDQIAVLPRKGRLYNGTILENISYFNPHLTIQALDAAALFGLDDVIAQFPRGYETEVKPHSNNTISAGLIQRISIARAFVSRPRIIVSDRSDELMDRDTLLAFTEVLTRLRGNTTIILMTSRQELLSIADNIYVLEEGRLTKQRESVYEQ